ncbi:MAG: helix-turn-helix domain-containing protein [Erythrobacter sp.]|uniref:Crp/Fnr family transcriptional regulator n=1 Tax=Erythrobacter sp. TaxID=1042 RepID=UPI0025FFAF49|nr:helix-turn-helix domain-containing protein [Erythrobacter sp.]MCL9998085.1 helix-turn-helix domain-containing protein [Erythrobacter sp.]
MATLSPQPPAFGLEQFRAALPAGTGEGRVADGLCALGEAAQLARGEELAPDPETDRLVWLASGAAKLVARGPAALAAGTPGGQVLAFHFAGDLVSVLRQKDGDFRLVALTACDLVIFPSDRFLDHAQGDPAVLRSVLTRSLQALHRSRTRMMQLGHKSAAARIADFLVSMAERLADCRAGTCAFALPMSRRDIGDSLGLTIETVSRQLTELREAGLVETEGRSKVAITDVGALARIAGRGGPAKN